MHWHDQQWMLISFINLYLPHLNSHLEWFTILMWKVEVHFGTLTWFNETTFSTRKPSHDDVVGR